VKTENEFLMARGQIAAKIAKLEKEMKYWRDELGAFDRVETTMRKLNTESNGEPKKFKLEPLDLRDNPESDIDASKRAEAIQQFQTSKKRGQIKRLVLKTVRTADGNVTTKDVERMILKEGFQPKGKNFNITLYKTLNRLADDGIIIRQKEAGVGVSFHAKHK